MSIKSYIKYFPVVLKYPLSITHKKKYVFIVSHIRSYSSLLSHILGSNKDINGYSELHYSYLNQFDSIKAKIQVMYTLGNSLDGKYILDKLLHNENQISELFLQDNIVKLIFLLRKPLHTYKSQINLGLQITRLKKHIDPFKVHSYYIKRLKMLEQQAKLLITKKIFIESESIINNTAITLEKLQEFLELESPLTNHYQQFKFTGNRNYGDPSDNIKKSVISANLTNYKKINIPKKIIEESNISYSRCKKRLIQYCNS